MSFSEERKMKLAQETLLKILCFISDWQKKILKDAKFFWNLLFLSFSFKEREKRDLPSHNLFKKFILPSEEVVNGAKSAWKSQGWMWKLMNLQKQRNHSTLKICFTLNSRCLIKIPAFYKKFYSFSPKFSGRSEDNSQEIPWMKIKS